MPLASPLGLYPFQESTSTFSLETSLRRDVNVFTFHQGRAGWVKLAAAKDDHPVTDVLTMAAHHLVD